MDDLKQKKEYLEGEIIDLIITGLQNGQVSEDDLPDIAGYVLDNIDPITSQDQLIPFLRNLSIKWPLFTGIKTIEEGLAKRKEEQIGTKNVLELTKEGRIEEALQLAKSLTKNN